MDVVSVHVSDSAEVMMSVMMMGSDNVSVV
jgi:hypothetical protein